MMELLSKGARALNLQLSEAQLRAFQIYYEELVAWNERFNLTTITSYENVQVKHFLDSLSCALALPKGTASCIDVGSGAGFPGIPLKIARPELSLALLETTGKKVAFLCHLIECLGLKEAQAIKGRAEELGQDSLHRERYEVVLARAVAPLPVLVEYTLPLCRVGGRVIAQKGPEAQAEALASGYGIAILGGKLARILPVELHGLAEERHLVIIEKVFPTPLKYPRRPGIPAKRPLGLQSPPSEQPEQPMMRSS